MLSESAEFYKIKATVMRAVRLYERPPAFMFAPNYRVLTFVEFDVGLTGKFWRFLQNLSLAAKDPNIIVFAVEPDAEEYFHKEFGKYGAVRLAAKEPENSYIERLEEHPEGWPVDSLKYNSEYLVWTSDSDQWVAWGSRGFGFIAIAFEDRFSANLNDLAKLSGITLFTREKAISDLISPSFRDTDAAQIFVNEFRKNY